MTECGICMSTYTPPVKILSCGHSFCQVCLIQMRRTQPREEQENRNRIDWGFYMRNLEAPLPAAPRVNLTCPTCRARTTLPQGRVVDLSTNFAVQNVINNAEGNQPNANNNPSPTKTVAEQQPSTLGNVVTRRRRNVADEFDVTPQDDDEFDVTPPNVITNENVPTKAATSINPPNPRATARAKMVEEIGYTSTGNATSGLSITVNSLSQSAPENTSKIPPKQIQRSATRTQSLTDRTRSPERATPAKRAGAVQRADGPHPQTATRLPMKTVDETPTEESENTEEFEMETWPPSNRSVQEQSRQSSSSASSPLSDHSPSERSSSEEEENSSPRSDRRRHWWQRLSSPVRRDSPSSRSDDSLRSQRSERTPPSARSENSNYSSTSLLLMSGGNENRSQRSSSSWSDDKYSVLDAR